jgi:hypothetical protein
VLGLLPKKVPEFYEEQARELLRKGLWQKTSFYFSPQTINLTTCRIAAAHPDLPLGAFARAAGAFVPRIKVFRVPTLQSSKESADVCSAPDPNKSMLKHLGVTS